MNLAATIAVILLALLPGSRLHTTERYGSHIVDASGGDLDLAAALAITAAREGQLRPDVERCRVTGDGGMGAFQLSTDLYVWDDACGPLDRQARAAARALRVRGWGDSRPALVFGKYIGARALERHPEARRRAALWAWARAEIDCLCSLAPPLARTH
jgi:hypothetical protein